MSQDSLSVVILTLNEKENLSALLPMLKRRLAELRAPSEIFVLDGNSNDGTAELARDMGCRAELQKSPGYGNALCQALRQAKGDYILTIDGDCSHDPEFIEELWRSRDDMGVIIASRYTKGGKGEMPLLRKSLSRLLNKVYSVFLSLPVKDLSSGYRLYSAKAIRELPLYEFKSKDFDILLEVIISLYCNGYAVKEVPFVYRQRRHGKSNARLFAFALSYLKTFVRMWRLRNAHFAADYDDRAYDSRIPIQRYWQRKRVAIIRDLAGHDGPILDVGCGSSKTVQTLPGSVGLDRNMGKLRFLKRRGCKVACGDALCLPFKANSFKTVISSEVIEHIPKDEAVFSELYRVLSSAGALIIGTPDYSSIWWRFIEKIYGAMFPVSYAEGHISRYSKKGIAEKIAAAGLKIEGCKSVLRAEVIFKARKL